VTSLASSFLPPPQQRGSKDAPDGSSKLNASTTLDMLPSNTVAHHGGNASDNASNAMLEGEKTFGLLMMEKLATLHEDNNEHNCDLEQLR
jgi:hypothetical protein